MKKHQPIFIDTSALLALFIKTDEFHKTANDFLDQAKSEKRTFITSNFVLDEFYTWIRAYIGKAKAVYFGEFLSQNTDIVRPVRVLLSDERAAWEFFTKLPGRKVSFTDCTSFALMNRLGLKEAFTFDRDFKKAGIKVLP